MPEEAVLEQAPARKLTLSEVTDLLTAWKDTLDGMDGAEEDFAVVKAKYAQIEAQHENKVDRYCVFLRWLDAEEKQYGADELRSRARKKAIERLRERRRTDALEIMELTGLQTLRGRCSSITLCEGEQHQRAHIDDISKLPPEYVTAVSAVVIEAHMEPKVDAIERDLKAGRDVPGARLTPPKPYIQIR